LHAQKHERYAEHDVVKQLATFEQLLSVHWLHAVACPVADEVWPPWHDGPLKLPFVPLPPLLLLQAMSAAVAAAATSHTCFIVIIAADLQTGSFE
jgi:hypothetical protein